MTRTNRLAWITRGIATICFGGLLAGCGGISPGDYKIYRVALATPKQSNGCFPNGPDPNTAFDSDNGVKDDTWEISANQSSAYFLTSGSLSLQGTKADSGYDFQETNIDVTWDGDDTTTNTKHTQTTTTDVPIAVDGASISGTMVVKVTQKCAGTNCASEVPVEGYPTCTTSTAFAGSRIDNITLYATPK